MALAQGSGELMWWAYTVIKYGSRSRRSGAESGSDPRSRAAIDVTPSDDV